MSDTAGRAPVVTVVGGGLAGCEVALQVADRGYPVRLIEQKPLRRTPAQTSDQLAELVCSNSFRSANPQNAIGLLKVEMRQVGSHVMRLADVHAVPAGDALAVDDGSSCISRLSYDTRPSMMSSNREFRAASSSSVATFPSFT